MKCRNEIMLNENDKIVTQKKDLCDIFCQYFTSIGSDIGQCEKTDLSLDDMLKQHNNDASIKQIMQNMLTRGYSFFAFKLVTEKDIELIFIELKTNDATGYDEIQAIFLKKLSKDIIPLLPAL